MLFLLCIKKSIDASLLRAQSLLYMMEPCITKGQGNSKYVRISFLLVTVVNLVEPLTLVLLFLNFFINVVVWYVNIFFK